MILIRKNNNTRESWYKPKELPSKFKVDGLNILVNYTVLDSTHNCGFGGYMPIIIINHIKAEK